MRREERSIVSRSYAKYLLAAGFLAAAWMVWPASRVAVFPPVSVDEAYLANHAYNLYTTGQNRYSLYDDLFEPSLYQWRDATAGLVQIVYQSWIGPFITWFPKSIAHARAASLVAGFITLLLFFAIGHVLAGVRGGFTALAAAALCPLFLFASMLVRAEIVLLMTSTLILFGLLRAPETHVLKYPLIGLFGGLQMGIHQNAVPFFIGLTGMALVRSSPRPRSVRLVFLGLAFLVGFAVVLSLIDLRKFIFSQQFLVFDLYRPPLLSWPWAPWDWLRQWARSWVLGTPTYYLHAEPLGGWQAGIALYWAAAAGLLVAALAQGRLRGSPFWAAIRPFAAGALTTFAGLCLWIRKNEALYILILMPFMIPLLCLASERLSHSKRGRSAIGGMLTLAFLSMAAFISFTYRYQATYKLYDSLVDDVHRVTAPADRIAGDCILWFAWPEEKFRDISALVGSRWMTGGKRDLATWLGRWRPDILVIGPSWKRMLLGAGSSADLLSKALSCPCMLLTTIDMGPVLEGPLEIVRVQWSKKRR